MKNILIFSFILTIMLIIGTNYATAQYPNPCGLNINPANCPDEATIEHNCIEGQSDPRCFITYKFCYGYNNGQPFVYIDYTIIRPTDCPCEDYMRHLALKAIFNDPNLQNYFGFVEPDTEYFIEIYVANCVEKIYIPGDQGTNGYMSYPGWKVVPCGNSNCCQHLYKIQYQWNCESNPCYLTVKWLNAESTSNFTNNCITPCFANCYNWTFYNGPPVEKFVPTKELNIYCDASQQTNFDIGYLFKEVGIDEFNGEIKIYSIEGTLLKILPVKESFDVLTFLKENNFPNKVYLYEFNSTKGILVKGKILLTK